MSRDREGAIRSPWRAMRPDVRTLLVLAGFAIYAALALYMYRPLSWRPFDMVDFSEFLPILRAHDGFWPRFVGLVEYYADHGRFNVLVYFFLALKWSLFDGNELAWQCARAVQMLVLTAATYALLRRLGMGVTGALFGAGLLVVSAPAARAWVRLTMAEPFGATAIVCAAVCGTYYQESGRWRRLALGIGALVALTLLAKEMLVAAVPLILFISWCRLSDGSFGRPIRSHRNTVLLKTVAAATALVLLPILVVAVQASPGAYVTAYGNLAVGPLDLLRLELFTLIPFVPLADPMPLGLAVAGLCYFVLLTMGLRLFAESARGQGRFQAILAVGLVYPLLGAVAYLPWPAYQWFYSVPFLIGPAVLVAGSVAGVEQRTPQWRGVAYCACLCFLVSMASDSLRFSRRSEASQFLVAAAVDLVSSVPQAESVFVAARELPQQTWQGLGPTLARYGRATGRPFPTTIDVSCGTALRRARQPMDRSVLLVFSSHCPYGGSPNVVVSREFKWFDWGHGEWKRDSISFAAFTGAENTSDRATK